MNTNTDPKTTEDSQSPSDEGDLRCSKLLALIGDFQKWVGKEAVISSNLASKCSDSEDYDEESDHKAHEYAYRNAQRKIGIMLEEYEANFLSSADEPRGR